MHSPSLPQGPFLLAIPGRREIHCENLVQASETYLRIAEQRKSSMPIATLRRLHHHPSLWISPNGKIWSKDPAAPDWTPGGEPVYDPYAQEMPSIDPLVAFDGWYRARTESARTTQGWTPETTLHADYLKFAKIVAPDAPILGEHGFHKAMSTSTRAESAPRMVRIEGSIREELRLCWSRALMRAIRVAA